MTTVKGTALAIVFAPDQRANLESDLAIAESIGSRLTGTSHPRSNSAVSLFPSILDCVRSAIAAVKWFTHTEEGMNGIGIGIDDDGNTESALLLAERGLTNVSHNILLADTIFWRARNLPGVDFQEVVEIVLPGRKEPNLIYSMTTQVGGFADVVDAAVSDDTAGWDDEPPTTQGGAIANMDETVVALDRDDYLEDGAASDLGASQPRIPKGHPTGHGSRFTKSFPETAYSGDDDETIVGTQPGMPGVEAKDVGVTADAMPDDANATLVDIPLPQGQVAVRQEQVKALQAALKLMEQAEEAARQFNRQSKPYSAIYEIDLVLANDAVQKLKGLEGPTEKLQAMRDECLAGKGISGGLLISGNGETFSIHRGPSLMIGRDPGDGTAGMKLRCQTLSRIPKQLRIDCHDKGYSITDLGSANGSYLDDRQLVPNQAVSLGGLDKGMTLSLGGVLDPPKKGECRLNLSNLGENGPGLLIRLQTSHLTKSLRSQLSAKWPDMDRECAGRWLYTEAPILIGGGKNCGLRLAPEENPDVLARIEWDGDEYTLVPISDQVKLNGAPILQPVVILDDATLSVLGREYQIKDNGG